MSFTTFFLAGIGATLLFLNLNRIITYIGQLLVDASNLDIMSITINSCKDDSFCINLTASITNTGPLSATISNMELTMHATKTGPAFARISLPPINACSTGTICTVTDQHVDILDQAAFRTFSKNLLLQDELPVFVQGSGTLTLPFLPGKRTKEVIANAVAELPAYVHNAVPFSLPQPELAWMVKYDKVEVVRGYDGVHIEVGETRCTASAKSLLGKGDKGPTAIEVDVTITSDSPIEVDMGRVKVEIVFKGVCIAAVQGQLNLKKGPNKVVFQGSMDVLSIGQHLPTGLKFLKKDLLDAPDGVEAFVRGVGGEQCAWLDDTVKLMCSRVKMGNTLMELIGSMGKSGEEEA